MNEYWKARGVPWEYDPGPPSDRRRAQIFAATPNYRGLGKAVLGKEAKESVVTWVKSHGEGSPEGYADDPGDRPYEPPRQSFGDYDAGPGVRFAQLFMGGQPGLEWPDFGVLGLTAGPSFGSGPIYRGRPAAARVLILADQQSQDDLFTGRALCGESGQRMQAFLTALGIVSKYVILRVLPVDTLSLPANTVAAAVGHPQTVRVYQAMVDEIAAASPDLKLVLTLGPHAQALRQHLAGLAVPTVALKAWQEPGALADWQGKIAAIRAVSYAREIANPSFSYDGRRGQIPRQDLPYGTLRWIGTSGDRASQAFDLSTQQPSADYFKLYMPRWAAQLQPLPLSTAEQAAVASL
jgi:hypothetical protein